MKLLRYGKKYKNDNFDEPEAGIDLWSFQKLIGVFEKMHESVHGSILIISHQERILNIADEIIMIADGQVVSKGTKEQILPEIFKATKGCGCKYYIRNNKKTRAKVEEASLDQIRLHLLEEVAGLHEIPAGAYNIRENGRVLAEVPQMRLKLYQRKMGQDWTFLLNQVRKRRVYTFSYY